MRKSQKIQELIYRINQNVFKWQIKNEDKKAGQNHSYLLSNVSFFFSSGLLRNRSREKNSTTFVPEHNYSFYSATQFLETGPTGTTKNCSSKTKKIARKFD